MVFEDRAYQIECEDALIKDVLASTTDSMIHPLAAVPTGAGKTKIMGNFIYKLLELCPYYNILILSHTENILKQDHEAISSFFPGIRIGLYSSGLRSRSIEKITVAGIQSVYKNAKYFKKFQIVIIDEAHTVPTRGNGMYRQFFRVVNATRIGLTATHFRTGHGLLHEGEGRMFNKLSYDLSSMDNFNKLVDDGYLTNLISKPTEMIMDVDGLRKAAGDFNQKDLSERFDRETITKRAVAETVNMGYNYKSWLVFAIDIAHADNITEELIKLGISAVSLHSRAEIDRHQVTEDFINKKFRALVSVGMVTTGFDAPNVDLLVLLRPTMSPVLHVQMVGRGLRVCEGKTHCLVLDFAGNTERLGPINNVQIPVKGKKKGNGQPITKRCPHCGCIFHPTVKICDVCGHEFEFVQKLRTSNSELEIVQRAQEKKERWVNVSSVSYAIHEKKNFPDSLKVTYHCGISSFSEYVCLNHNGYAKHMATNWVSFRWTGKYFPLNVAQLFRESNLLKVPKRLYIDSSSKYIKIKDIEF